MKFVRTVAMSGHELEVSAALVVFGSEITKLLRKMIRVITTQIVQRVCDRLILPVSASPTTVEKIWRALNQQQRHKAVALEVHETAHDGAIICDYNLPRHGKFSYDLKDKLGREFTIHCSLVEKQMELCIFHLPTMLQVAPVHMDVLQQFVTSLTSKPLVKDTKPQIPVASVHFCQQTGNFDWDWTYQDARLLENKVLTPEMQSFLSFVNAFYGAKNKEEMAAKGVPYRCGVILEGPSGTGKSSVVEICASRHNKPLYNLSLTSGGMNITHLQSLVQNILPHSIVVLDEMQSHFRVFDQKSKQLQPGDFLAAISGAASHLPTGCLFVATTNSFAECNTWFKKHDALLNPGRFGIQFQFTTKFETHVSLFQSFRKK